MFEAPDPKSIPLSAKLFARNPMRSWFILIRFSPAGTLKSRPLGQGPLFLQSIRLANMQRPVGSRPMERMSGTSIAKPVSMQEGFFRV
jgi:hypothetical protein